MKIRGTIFLLVIIFLLGTYSTAAAESGYGKTVHWWQGVVGQTGEYSLILQGLYAQTEQQAGTDKSHLNKDFSKQLSQSYPGSVYYGSLGYLALNGYTMIFFDAHWNINALTQKFGSLTKSYNFRDQTFEIVDGPNRIKFKVDLNRPGRSRFVSAAIPAISATARRVWAEKGRRQRSPYPLKDILNDAYAYRIAGDGTRMDRLAEQILEDQLARQSVFDLAEEAYSQSVPEAGSSPRAPSIPSSSFQPQPTPRRQSSSPFSFLPWYFWLIIFGGAVVKVLTHHKGHGTRPRGSSVRKRRGEFSWGKLGGTKSIPLEKTEDVKSASMDFSFSDEFRDLSSHVPGEWNTDLLCSLEWKRFESVCAEYLRLIGLSPEETKIGPDGGVDIWVYKQGIDKPVGIVQCKAWNTYKVGVKPVRELFGVMAAEGVANGKFMTTGEFTAEALAFAKGKKMALISGGRFLAAIRKLPLDSQKALLEMAVEGDYRTPTCPQCGVKMTLRRGKNGGREFWGCHRYPRCRAVLNRKTSDEEKAFDVAAGFR